MLRAGQRAPVDCNTGIILLWEREGKALMFPQIQLVAKQSAETRRHERTVFALLRKPTEFASSVSLPRAASNHSLRNSGTERALYNLNGALGSNRASKPLRPNRLRKCQRRCQPLSQLPLSPNPLALRRLPGRERSTP